MYTDLTKQINQSCREKKNEGVHVSLLYEKHHQIIYICRDNLLIVNVLFGKVAIHQLHALGDNPGKGHDVQHPACNVVDDGARALSDATLLQYVSRQPLDINRFVESVLPQHP